MQIPRYEGGVPKWNFNTLVTAGGVCATIIATAIGWGINWSTIQNNDRELTAEIGRIRQKFVDEELLRRERISNFNEELRDLRGQLAILPSLTFGVNQAKEMGVQNAQKIEEANQRVDRVVDSFADKLDTAIDSLNKVATRVEVLGSKLDDMKRDDQGRQTNFKTPILRP